MSVAGPPPSEILSLSVSSLAFGWYQPDELLKLSVKRVTQPHIYDNLNQPIAGGLYDPTMGPLEKHETCVTCGLKAIDCMGHMGHIQLSLPVYHPLLFDLLYKLMKAKCFTCHKFRCSRMKLKLVLTKLRLLDAGLLMMAKDVDDLALKSFSLEDKPKQTAAQKRKAAAEKEGGSDEESDSEPMEDQTDAVKNRLDEYLAIAEKHIRQYGTVRTLTDEEKEKAGSKKKKHQAQVAGVAREPTSHEMNYRRELVSTFFKEIQSKKCTSCGAFSPSLRRDGHTKIFRIPLTKAQQQTMDLLNLKMDDVLALTEGGFEKGSENWAAMMKERNFYKEFQAIVKKNKEKKRAEAAAARKAREKTREKKNASTESKAQDDIEGEPAEGNDSDAEDDDEADDVAEEKPYDQTDDEEDEEEDSEDRPITAATARKTMADAKKKRKSIAGSAAETAAEEEGDDGARVRIKIADEDAEDLTKRTPELMFATEVEKHIELLWKQESQILHTLWGSMVDLLQVSHNNPHYSKPSNDHRMFFLRVLCVPPSRFRPPTRFGDMVVDHPQNVYFKHILEMDVKLQKMQRGEKIEKFEKKPEPAKKTPKKGRAATDEVDEKEQKAQPAAPEKAGLDLNLLILTWIGLQTEVNMLLDSTKGGQASNLPNVTPGIRQMFEKKEGLFRKNMMGKRVNFAARSVISPDPFINTDEVGIPEMFATQLSFPEPVTPFNVAYLRQAVINGPKVHPGANFVEDERGNLIDLAERSYPQRVALSKTLLTTGLYDSNKHRTKGGSLSHPATANIGQKRVLRHVRTGDVVIVNRQPTLHKPSMMTHKVRVMRGRASKTQMPNAMWQTIRMHYANCNCYNADFDGDEMNLHVPQNELARSEAYHIANADNQYILPMDGSPLRGLIQDNVLTGVLLTKIDTFLDRQTYQQLLFSCLQISPTLKLRTPVPTILKPATLWTGKQVIKGVLDLLTANKPPLNLESKAKVPASSWGQHSEESVVIIRNNELLSGVLDKAAFGDAQYGLVHAVYELYGGPTSGELMSTLGRLFTLYLQRLGFTCGIDDMLLEPKAEQARAALKLEAEGMGLKAACQFAEITYDPAKPREINRVLQEKMKADKANGARLDSAMKSALNPFTSNIIDACLPGGQVKAFPDNCMSLMTLSGAKGSKVNFSQISCLLGQQELEGRRVPMMATGKTLPSFRKYDPSPRAGGYVADRFLTGVKPQEYYHHCMAGREGLIDTAVKTSRSGYLQRCLIKHLESLVVNYDATVRDADGSVIQFTYGEDSVDVLKSGYLDRFSFLTNNFKALVHKLNPAGAVNSRLDITSADNYLAQADASKQTKKSKKSAEPAAPLDPVLSVYNPGRYLGSVSEKFSEAMTKYIQKDPDGLIKRGVITDVKFKSLMKMHYLSCLVHPGESVGILASQSIGEPSTQMTLNTFHLAGHGGANVTLGIPRLREIIMTASDKLKTPVMEVPLVPGKSRADAERIASQLNRLHLTSYITNATCKESMAVHVHGSSVRLYTVRLNITPMTSESIKSNGLTFDDFRSCFERQFCVQLNAAVAKQVKVLAKGHAGTPVIVKGGRAQSDRDEVAIGGSARGELDAVTASQKAKHREHTSYDAPDEEDRAAIAEMEAQEKQRADVSSDDEDQIDPDARAQAAAKKAAAKAAAAKLHDDADAATALGTERAAPSFNVLSKCPYLSRVNYDSQQQWLECVVQVSLGIPKLLMMSMVEGLLGGVLLRATPRIAKSFVVEKFDPNSPTHEKKILVQTDGINFQELYKHQHLFDVNKISSNDIAAILRTYGVEAARASIVRELTSVFQVYGIGIDPRHLGLVADYMTFNGGFRPLNRAGIDSNPSPFQKISFETSIGFLMNACLFGDKDFMSSPSSRIVMGRPVGCGTGSFDLMNPVRFDM